MTNKIDYENNVPREELNKFKAYLSMKDVLKEEKIINRTINNNINALKNKIDDCKEGHAGIGLQVAINTLLDILKKDN